MKKGDFDAAQAQYQEILARYGTELKPRRVSLWISNCFSGGDLQKARKRPDLAVASHLRVFQDLLSSHWGLSWEESQFFARHLTEKIQELKNSMSGCGPKPVARGRSRMDAAS